MQEDKLFLYTDTEKGEASSFYFSPYGLKTDSWVFLQTARTADGKTPSKKVVDGLLGQLFELPVMANYKLIVTNNSNYFKTLTGVTKVETYIGALMYCKFSDAKVVYVPAIGSVLYSPNKYQKLLDVSMELVQNFTAGIISNSIKQVLKNYFRPVTKKGIKKALEGIAKMNRPIAIDVEAYSLDHPIAGLGTVAFGLDEHSSIAIPVDHNDKGRKVNREVRAMLKEFFIKTKEQKHIYHNIGYDAKILVYSLFMESVIDRKGMIEGINTIMHNFEDTQIISYLCFNSTDRPDLSLKYQALEYAGNWASLVGEDIKDISKVDNETLCKYNAIDTTATLYVYNKNYPLMVEEEQEEIYIKLFKPTQKVLVKSQLTGICIDMPKVKELDKNLTLKLKDLEKDMFNYVGVSEFNEELRVRKLEKENAKRKKLKKDLDSIEPWLFNPGSAEHIRIFLYEKLDMPVVHFTDSGAPSTNAKAIEDALSNENLSEGVKKFLRYLAEYNKIAIIVNTFIPAFKKAYLADTGDYYVFGNYKITGTVSGRLSSNNPNLQNIPAHSIYGELIKECVKAPKGYIMIGLDSDSLEDKISALTTKDPNKLAVYIDGLDGHCFNTYGYFEEDLPDIDPSSVASINSIKKLYPELRQESKPYTFLLTYQGGIGAMMKQFGISREKATRIYNAYHARYSVSRQWVSNRLEQAREDGYVVGAFGLKIRTPLMKATRHSSPNMRPYVVRAEEKTAGNGLGQSWCSLTNRSAVEMDEEISKDNLSEYILLSMLIHDALYYYVKDEPKYLKYTNDKLVKAFAWQDHPEIAHDKVKLSGTMSIFYPNWNNEREVPKYSSLEEISTIYAEVKNV